MTLPTYDPSQTYQWNYDCSPDPVAVDVPNVDGEWTFCGLPVGSPLGVAAGPLLNGRWLLYYASLGFDVLTYKTVRSQQRDCYGLPNLVPVRTKSATGSERVVPVHNKMEGTWAVSFGMPSATAKAWQDDVRWARDHLPADKVLCVSVVASMQPGWTLDDLADDYARCARWAVDSGADVVETNFSCPNVATPDGQLYQQFEAASVVAARVRDAIGLVPYCVKLGHIRERAVAAELLGALAPHVTALSMTNCISAVVASADGSTIFDGEQRGIAGSAILDASVAQVSMFAELIRERGLPTRIVGIGGAATASDVGRYLDAGAECVHVATAAMIDPEVALKIRAAGLSEFDV